MGKKIIDKEFLELDNLNTFLKLKANAYAIGKQQVAFVSFDKSSGKIKNSIDCYLSMADAMLLAQDILSGKLAQLAKISIDKANKAGSKYPASIWSSTLGGVKEEDAKKRGMRTDGKAVSRVFDIAPGASKPFVITAKQGPGMSDDKGLIAPAGKPEITIRVAMTADDLKKIALMIQSFINAYHTAGFITGEYYKELD